MNRRTPQIVALTILLPATIYGSISHAQEMFKLLGEKEIRARVVGRDITDSSHWVSYLRPDGVLLSSEMGRKWTGIWKIQNNKLCMSNPNLESPHCNEVWMSGANIRMRANKDQEAFRRDCREAYCELITSITLTRARTGRSTQPRRTEQ